MNRADPQLPAAEKKMFKVSTVDILNIWFKRYETGKVLNMSKMSIGFS